MCVHEAAIMIHCRCCYNTYNKNTSISPTKNSHLAKKAKSTLAVSAHLEFTLLEYSSDQSAGRNVMELGHSQWLFETICRKTMQTQHSLAVLFYFETCWSPAGWEHKIKGCKINPLVLESEPVTEAAQGQVLSFWNWSWKLHEKKKR